MTHEEFQQQVVDLAHALGWQHLHVRRTIGRGKKWTTSTNVKGWPDLFLWHPTRGGAMSVELKVGKDEPTLEQAQVLASLTSAGIPSFVWYPHHLDVAKAALYHQRGKLRPSL